MFLKSYKRLGGILAAILFVSQSVAQNYPAELDLSKLSGKSGFIIPGLNDGDRIGSEVDFIGDINNDGLDDICLGSQFAQPHGLELEGTTYIIFGSRNPSPASFDLNALNGSNGFKVFGIGEDERRGKSARGLGDVNGDGIDDMIIGTEQEKIMVLYGSSDPFPASMTINDVDGTNGFIIDGDGMNEVSKAGDINGDGINDILLGQAHWSGETWVIFGQAGNFPAHINASLLDGKKGFRLTKIQNATISAFLVGPAGDVNADGYDDIMIGNWAMSSPSSAPAKTFVFFGKAGNYNPLIDINLLNGTDGAAITNYNIPGFLKWVGTVGDINDDGIDDFFSHQNIIFGSTAPFPAVITAENSLNGTKGFIIPDLTQTAAPAGDLNFDGIDDFILVAKNQENWAIFGSKNPYEASFNPEVLDGTKGFRMKNINQSNIGRQISGGKDFNGDGLSDFIIGSESTGKGGTVFVVFGGDHYLIPMNAEFPKATDISAASINLQVNTPEPGKIYYAVYPGNMSVTLSTENILNDEAAYKRGNFQALSNNTLISHVISDLHPETLYDIYLFQEDTAGNKGQIYKLSITTLSDTEAPLILCPKEGMNVSLENLPDLRNEIQITDNVDKNPTIEQIPEPGTIVTPDMSVTINATDNAGNKRSCSFIVNATTPVKSGVLSTISIYPVPTTDVINIEGISNFSFLIFNNLGHLKLTGANTKNISLEFLEAGMYMLFIYSEDNQLISQKKIAKH